MANNPAFDLAFVVGIVAIILGAILWVIGTIYNLILAAGAAGAGVQILVAGLAILAVLYIVETFVIPAFRRVV